MNYKFFILPAALIFQVAGAQSGPSVLPVAQTTLAEISVSPTPSVTLNDPTASTSEGTLIMDYKSVYDVATLEEEVQKATERFSLTKSQQDVWSVAAYDRRAVEKQAYEKLNSNATDYSKAAVYSGLRSAHNTFYETITGYLTPAQKQAMVLDREIMAEKQKRLAKIPPPPPTVTVAPVDSTLIKQEMKIKEADLKKAKKKKKKVAA